MESPIVQVRRAARAGRAGSVFQTPADNHLIRLPSNHASRAMAPDRSATYAGIGLIWRDGVRMTPAQTVTVAKSLPNGRIVRVRAVSLVYTDIQTALRTLPARRRMADRQVDRVTRAARVIVTDHRKSLPVAQSRRPRTDMEKAAARAAIIHNIVATRTQTQAYTLDALRG